MKIYKKTYGLLGELTELTKTYGSSMTRIAVNFTGGGKTQYGKTPAHVVTDNPIVQHAIETSRDFEDGLVFVISSYDTGREVELFGEEEMKAAQAAKFKAEEAEAAKPEAPEEPEEEKPREVRVADKNAAVQLIMETGLNAGQPKFVLLKKSEAELSELVKASGVELVIGPSEYGEGQEQA